MASQQSCYSTFLIFQGKLRLMGSLQMAFTDRVGSATTYRWRMLNCDACFLCRLSPGQVLRQSSAQNLMVPTISWSHCTDDHNIQLTCHYCPSLTAPFKNAALPNCRLFYPTFCTLRTLVVPTSLVRHRRHTTTNKAPASLVVPQVGSATTYQWRMLICDACFSCR